MMELTIENLISHLRKKLTYDGKISSLSKLRTFEDGVGMVYVFEDLENQFKVSFENFDFYEYFLDEAELNTLSWKYFFGLKKQRKIEKELTIQKLYEYMIQNRIK